jgi:lysozyme
MSIFGSVFSFVRPAHATEPQIQTAPQRPSLTAGRVATWLTVAVTVVAAFEGYYGHTYRDSVGVKTICYGATAADGVDFDRTYTKAECQAMLAKDLVKYDAMVHTCIRVPLTPNREAALVSFTYNLGQGALCHGNVARLLNAGDVAGGCRAMLAYDHAGGRRLTGLTRRRQQEYKLCLQ